MKKSVHFHGILLICAVAVIAGCSSRPPAPVVEKEARGMVVGGYVLYPDKSREGQVAQQREVAAKQARELKRQKDELDDIERQQFYDSREKRYLDGRALGEDAPAVAEDNMEEIDPGPAFEEAPVKERSRSKRY